MDYTQSDVDRILGASRKATPGKWEVCPDGHGFPTVWSNDDIVVGEEGIFYHSQPIDEANAILIAGSPILAEEVKRLRAENETLRAELTNWPIDYPPDDMV
jgi:hypothetical protein